MLSPNIISRGEGIGWILHQRLFWALGNLQWNLPPLCTKPHPCMKSRPNWESPSLIFIYPTIRGKAKLSRPRMENPNRRVKNENSRNNGAKSGNMINAPLHGQKLPQGKSAFLLFCSFLCEYSLFLFFLVESVPPSPLCCVHANIFVKIEGCP